jgi:hypothetical protein
MLEHREDRSGDLVLAVRVRREERVRHRLETVFVLEKYGVAIVGDKNKFREALICEPSVCSLNR